jgi:hypothetical protein
MISEIGKKPMDSQTLRRAATLAVWCELGEAGLAQGRELDIAEFTTATMPSGAC